MRFPASRTVLLLGVLLLGMLTIASTAPLRGAALGEPTVLRLQRFAAISPGAGDDLPSLDGEATSFLFAGGFEGQSRNGRGAWDGFTPPGRLVEQTPPVFTETDSVASASRELRRGVRVPRLLEETGGPQAKVTLFTASSASYVLDLPALHADMALAGVRDLQLPTSLHGARLTLNVPAGVRLQWGEGARAVALTQVRQPTLIVPPQVDLESLHDLLLVHPAIVAIDPEVVSQLKEIDDWRGTLPVPVPPRWTGDEAEVDGTRGLLMSAPDKAASILLWQSRGTVNVLSGGLPPELLVAGANSLR